MQIHINMLANKKILFVGHCDICDDKLFTDSSFVVMASKKRFCLDCYEESSNPLLKSSPNNE